MALLPATVFYTVIGVKRADKSRVQLMRMDRDNTKEDRSALRVFKTDFAVFFFHLNVLLVQKCRIDSISQSQ